ncbi:long-chain-acyl-CoA synthetase [Acinetobacter gerneri]|uniref:Long-chain-acyl-CoA synthetase n=1 Tax=Acinetobacter gerneri TaxID=202952 RepID=A0AAW8JIV1_9GAMM|nr:long-chain-acyl-CoA synthetase [Acinetobacter gerneri]MDQ9010730.1 long-chain-acyl-CoA synthetase [Acinetobacter gerneri]MDQ9014444.1 long-chain-acyl-CoA synthetase [Acinetobacter gerneri]MDQ9025615.1 long-chain-acyl-CoA synthetase [Acinetobacter gerneri]MDQ9052896.1 long-chain-acyl-CoA synthetase [Acinetobacter gerneri]MDQ9060501.1 long-chain-acyl-CoA synthetase [Acinetobacter gerneri]
MTQAAKADLIHISDVAARIPKFLNKVPNLLTGLKQAYLRTPNTPAGLGLAFEKAVKRNPLGDALLFEDQRYSYQELNQWANQIAHYYLSKGVKKGDVIAVIIENRSELVATIVALAKIGVTSALVNTSQTGKVLTHSVNLVKPVALIVGEECRQAVDDIRQDLNIDENHFYWFADQATRENAGTTPKGYHNLAEVILSFPMFNVATTQTVKGKDGLFYIYTSGTTGLPKAVIFTNSRWTLAYGTYGHILGLNEDDVMYVTLPLYHATGMVVCWCGVIAGSSALAIRRKYSTSAFWDDVRKYKASAIGYVGELCRYLMDAPPSESDRAHRVTKMIGNGMRPNIWSKFKERFGIEEVLELYASSEGNVGFSNIFNFDNTVGFSPTPYAIIQFDKEKNEPVHDSKGFCKKVVKGDVGLLVGKITSRSPFDGYTDEKNNTSVIMKDVFKKGDSYFITGDLVRDIGFRHAQFVDRLGDTFRWKGENVSTTEVENICSEYPKIVEAVVYGVEIPNTNGRAGMAAITLQDGAELNDQDLTDMVTSFKKDLPPYAVPVFLRVQKVVETTGTFKYQKNKLKEQAFDPNKTSDRLLVLLPGQSAYCDISPEIFSNIEAYKYRF